MRCWSLACKWWEACTWSLVWAVSCTQLWAQVHDDLSVCPLIRASLPHLAKRCVQGSIYRQREKSNKASQAPKVALVLGAGNQVSVVVLDILHMLLAVDCTVVCKINPVNAFIGPAVR